MRRWRSFSIAMSFCLLLAVWAGAAIASDEATDASLAAYLATLHENNLMINPDFELENENLPGQPLGWEPTLSLMDFNQPVWDKNVSLSGERSLRMSGPLKTESVWASVPVEVEAETTYRFTGYVKTENLNVERARFYGTFFVQAMNGDRMLFPRPTAGGDNLEGTNDWTKVSFEFMTPRNTTHVIVTATLASFGKGTGHVWFDALKLEEVVVE